MPKVFTSDKQKIGEIGENIAEKFLVKQGFFVIDRNYTKKWGEIDIVAQKDNKLYFIEVKSVSSFSLAEDVPHETDDYRAEDNMHPWKMKRLSRTIQTYLLNKNIDDEMDWQVDLLVVYLDLKNKKSKVKVVSDIIL
ncbi:MAG TPA: YraN family protein [Candidatus Paceibacterota bacterium]|jgi:putative endonuclease|nr:YraN family protein [Candidatus Paceibacterota bacterium]